MHAILFSLPGSPVLYYGDEIGMGDNIYLGDRDGVRTPMQWTGDRNSGFSRADFHQLYLPPLMDPVYGYQAVNVEAQLRTPTSLLRWLRRLIELRKQHPVFGLGTYEGLSPRTRAYSRTSARTATRPSCACTTSPARPRRWSWTSRGSRVGSPWRCSAARASRASAHSRISSRSARAGSSGSSSRRSARERARARRRARADRRETLVDFILRQRWYGAKAQEARHAQVLDIALLRTQPPPLVCAVVELRFQSGTHDLYQLLVGARPAGDGWTQGVIAERDGWTFYDALSDSGLARELVSMMRAGLSISGGRGAVEFGELGCRATATCRRRARPASSSPTRPSSSATS